MRIQPVEKPGVDGQQHGVGVTLAQLGDVSPGREHAGGRRVDDQDGGLLPRLGQNGTDLVDHGLVERVAHVRAVEPDPPDRVVATDLHRARHAHSSATAMAWSALVTAPDGRPASDGQHR
jgi:hypothetical protein